MPAHRVVSLQQLEMLIAFMEENRDLAVGRRATSGPLAMQRVTSRWEAVGARLNAVGVGATKSGRKWRDYWNERKYAVRKRALLRSQQDPGDGSPLPGPWTAMDEKIMRVLGNEPVFPLDHSGATVQKAHSDMSEIEILSPDVVISPRRISPSRQEIKTKRIIYRRRAETTPPAGVLQLEERKLAVEQRTMRAVERVLKEVAGIRTAMERRWPDKELEQNDESQNNSLPVSNLAYNVNKNISQKRDHSKTSEKINSWPTDEFDFFGCSMAIQLKKLPELEALGVMQKVLFMMTDIKKKLKEESDKKKLKHSQCYPSNPLKRPTSSDNDMMAEKDEFDFFGCSMAIQLKNLPELDALEVMQKMLSMVTDIKKKLKEKNDKKKLKLSLSNRSNPLKRPTSTSTPEHSSDSITDSFEQETGQRQLELTEQVLELEEQDETEEDTGQVERRAIKQENFLITLEHEPDAGEYIVLRT